MLSAGGFAIGLRLAGGFGGAGGRLASADEGSVGVASGVGPLLAAACLAASFLALDLGFPVFVDVEFFVGVSVAAPLVKKCAVGNDC